MPPKSMLLMTLTMPRPPGSRPTSSRHKSQATGDARRVHDLPHEHEQGECNQGIGMQSGKHPLGQNGEQFRCAVRK